MNQSQHYNNAIKHTFGSLKDPYTLIVETINSNLGKEYSDSFTTIPISSSADLRWLGGVLAPNGCIYCAPCSETRVLKIDTSDDSVSYLDVSPTCAYAYAGCILSRTGYIYFIPAKSKALCKLDLSTDTVIHVKDLYGDDASSIRFYSGVEAPNGCIYCMPYRCDHILKIDPNTDNFSSLAVDWDGLYCATTVIAPNGCIYGFPSATSRPVIKIDTTDDSISYIDVRPDSDSLVGYDFASSALFSDYCIYAFIQGNPGGSSSAAAPVKVLKFNTLDDTFELITLGPNAFINSAVLSPNGCIYILPKQGGTNSRQLIRYDVTNNSYTTILLDMMPSQYQDCVVGGILGSNGYIYMIPYDDKFSSIIKLDSGVGVFNNFPREALLSQYINRSF